MDVDGFGFCVVSGAGSGISVGAGVGSSVGEGVAIGSSAGEGVTVGSSVGEGEGTIVDSEVEVSEFEEVLITSSANADAGNVVITMVAAKKIAAACKI